MKTVDYLQLLNNMLIQKRLNLEFEIFETKPPLILSGFSSLAQMAFPFFNGFTKGKIYKMQSIQTIFEKIHRV
jgi:hypothetical protein